MILTVLAFVALAAWVVHLRWRCLFLRAQETSRAAIEQLKDSQERAAHQIQTQQEALFNSMIEGLLLLDEHGRIELANRAFSDLFGLTTPVRGKTIVEALRLTELAALVESVTPQEQLLGHELRL